MFDQKLGLAKHFLVAAGPGTRSWTEGKPYFLAAGFGLNNGWASKNALKGLQKVS